MHGIGKRRAGRATAIALAGICLVGIASCGSTQGHPAQAGSGAKTPVVVDTDMSSDDIMALAYLLERRDVAVQAITVEGTGVADGPAGARNVLRLIRALGVRRPIPVAYGTASPTAGTRSFPRAWRAGADRMYGLGYPRWTGAPPRAAAVRLLVRTLNRSAGPVTLVTLGPFTDIALALRADPAIAGKIARIYAMAGAVRVPGNEPAHRMAEWNVYIDPAAARSVMTAGIPMTVVPLDASNSVPITTFFRDAAQAHRGTAAMRMLATMLNDPFYTQAPVYFWDPLAAVAATDPSVLRQRTARLMVVQAPASEAGATRISPVGTAVRLAVSADAAAFAREFLTTLNGGRPLTIAAVPASQRLMVGFDGSNWSSHVPADVSAGTLSVRLANSGTSPSGGFQLIIGKLDPGKTIADVRTVIDRGPVTSVPAWFHVMSVLPGPPGAEATWGIALLPGHYALVSALERNGALRALIEIRLPA